MKKKFLIAIASVFVTTFVFLALFCHSQAPIEWRALSLGMPREEVLSHISTRISDQRYVKGFDMTKTPRCRRFGALGFWMLMMCYDSSERLSDIEIEFVCYDDAQRNGLWPSQLLYRIDKGSILRRWNK